MAQQKFGKQKAEITKSKAETLTNWNAEIARTKADMLTY
jgi:hypothetical protein